jgi:hypothetical protein
LSPIDTFVVCGPGLCKYPRSTQQQTCYKRMCPSVVTGTVLLAKRYPQDEFAVKLHGSAAVVSLRDVCLLTPEMAQRFHEASKEVSSDAVAPVAPVFRCSGGLVNVSRIEEGATLVLHDVGVWNVNTTALHGAKVTLNDDDGGTTTDSESSRNNNNNNIYKNSTTPNSNDSRSSVLPQRRKHNAMSAV